MILFTAVRLARNDADSPAPKKQKSASSANDSAGWSFADRDRMQIALFQRDMEAPKTIAMTRCGKRVRFEGEV